uniref:Lipopolysaccahride biosynthesis n=1 Tax=Edwardsiella tarda TaxID=636 RepID=Q4ACG9_EDWTA|nr:lipopolysaccahride biosynthesis [Edwardsiella tarda]
MSHPAFIITIDTEGDNLWQNHDRITTENARYLPRFQQLCEKYGFKPVYLTNYEMASDPVYVEFAQDVIARGCGEVGMHSLCSHFLLFNPLFRMLSLFRFCFFPPHFILLLFTHVITLNLNHLTCAPRFSATTVLVTPHPLFCSKPLVLFLLFYFSYPSVIFR